MREVLARRDEGRLREEGGVVVSPAAVGRVGQTRDLGELVAPDALLARPDRPVPPAQIQRRELLPAAGHMLVFLRPEAQPEAVDAVVRARAVKAQQPAVGVHAQAVFPVKIAVGKAQRVPLRAEKAQREALREPVADREVAAVHLNVLASPAQKQGRTKRAVIDQQSAVQLQPERAGRGIGDGNHVFLRSIIHYTSPPASPAPPRARAARARSTGSSAGTRRPAAAG